MKTKLKNCPFCGGKDVALFGFLMLYVYCFTCKAEGPKSEDKKLAIAKWNRRAKK